jgi:IS30 family transposase
MGRSYQQLSLEDRCEIARLSANSSSIRQIATALDRPPSTISRELKRNRGAQLGYKPSYAQQQTRARRWKGSRLERDEALRAAVIERLASGWSPEQIAGRLQRDKGRKVISYESIYRFIYAQLPAPGIIAGGAICRAARANAVAGAGRAEVRKTSLKAVFPWQNGRSRLPTATPAVTGKPT